MTGKVDQYLRTEYIQPPSGSPTLDAKHSPLALLAQTCSAIGKEPRNFKNLNCPSNRFSVSEGMTSSSKTLNKTMMCSSASVTSQIQASSSPDSNARRLSSIRVLKREKSSSTENAPSKKPRRSPEASVRRYSEKRQCEGSISFQSEENNGIIQKQESKRRQRSFHGSPDQRILKPSSTHKLSSSCSPHSRRCSSKQYDQPPMLLPLDQSRHSIDSASPHSQMIPFHDPYHVDCRGQPAADNFSLDVLKTPHLPFYAVNDLSNAYPFYAQMFLAAAARNTGFTVDSTPHVCNWFSAETGNCGKKFSSSDELFHHLRTHVMTKANTNLHSRSNSLMTELQKIARNPYAAFLSQQASVVAASTLPTVPKLGNTNLLLQNHNPQHKYNSYKNPNIFTQRVRLPSLSTPFQSEPCHFPYTLSGYDATRELSASVAAYSYP